MQPQGPLEWPGPAYKGPAFGCSWVHGGLSPSSCPGRPPCRDGGPVPTVPAPQSRTSLLPPPMPPWNPACAWGPLPSSPPLQDNGINEPREKTASSSSPGGKRGAGQMPRGCVCARPALAGGCRGGQHRPTHPALTPKASVQTGLGHGVIQPTVKDSRARSWWAGSSAQGGCVMGHLTQCERMGGLRGVHMAALQ